MRVFVCRARDDAERTATRLRASGHDPVIAPVLRIVATCAPRPAGAVDAILTTSGHAIETAGTALEPLRRKPLFAVGDATARTARQAGFEDVRTSRGDAEDLATLVALTLPRPAHLLYVCGRDRKPRTEAALIAAGYTVALWETYAAEPEPAWDEAARRAVASGSLDAALHYSARSATLALSMADRHGLHAPFGRLAHLCLSEDVAAVLRAATAPRVRVAARPDEASLLALLADEAR